MSESLYVHFPYCVHLCNYCDFYKKKYDGPSDFKSFQERLQGDWDQALTLADQNGLEIGRDLETVYLGGGTPSLWDRDGARFFENFLKENRIRMTDNAEVTLEADPGAWTEKGIDEWQRVGVNRFSVGAQSYSDEFLRIMDRHHDKGEAQRTLKYFKERRLSFSVDLMLGLPYSLEKKRNIIKELEQLLEFRPEHLSVYILKTRSNYPHNEMLPDDEYIRDEYLAVSDFLRGSGFDHYEVSNFSKQGKESKHNLKYWEAQNVHAIGPNATGFMLTNNGAIRYQNKPSGGAPTLETLGPEELLLETVYLGLRTNRGINLMSKLAPNGPKVQELSDVIKNWSNSGHLEKDRLDHVILSPSGYLMIDSLIDDLFKKNLL